MEAKLEQARQEIGGKDGVGRGEADVGGGDYRGADRVLGSHARGATCGVPAWIASWETRSPGCSFLEGCIRPL